VLQERCEKLEKAFEGAQQQAAQHRQQMAEMHDTFKKTTKVRPRGL
jgi:prefoldin subunit 5